MFSEPAVGDDRTFERLYSSYATNVFRYALTVVGQRADAEDVTQTTFMNAYRAIQRGERPEKPEQWLISIAHNACLQRFRHNQRRPREVALHNDLAVVTLEDDSATTVEELQRAIEQLPPAQRAALVMRELEGRSYADMAVSLKISVSALETLLFRARRTLREQLGEQLACCDATAAIEKQLNGRLPNDERRALRAHLRTCDECAALARSRRAQGKSLRGLLDLPFSSWLGRLVPALARAVDGASSTGGMGAAGIAVKAAAVVVAGTVVGSGAYVGATRVGPFRTHSTPTNASRGATRPATAQARAARSHGVTAAAPAGLQSGSTSQGLPAPVGGPTNVSVDSPASAPPTGSSDAGGAVTAATVAGTETTARQPTAETSGAQVPSGPATTTVSSTQSDSPATVPPGQAKKNANGNAASANAQGASNGTKVPPGQAKKDATSSGNANANANADGNGNGNGNSASANAQGASNGTKVPPGQAKKDAPAGDSGNASSPGSTASEPSAAPAASAAVSVPPGQAKKDTPPTTPTDPAPAAPAASPSTPPAANVPPGQAKKDTPAPADPAPTDPASTTTTPAPPAAPPAPKTPPGQAKKNP